MTNAYKQFKINIDGLDNLQVVYEAFVRQVAPLDISDILRSKIVLSVSALDCYIHDLCEEAMIFIFENKTFQSNNAFTNFPISLGTLHTILSTSSRSDQILLLKKEIKKSNGYKSFQEPENISKALSQIEIKSIWNKVGVLLSKEATDIRKQLSLIIQRRNQIAHESDINPMLGLGEKYFIDLPMVLDAKNFIKSVVDAIETTIATEKLFEI